ncbi:MAG: aromatic ring hydroxylase [Frankiales bacterium]|nr:aromatic ring hydroxylase [Frankiales bacterium]
MSEVQVPVLIIGGGGCGLSASIFLSNLGVEHLLVERHESTSILPKAHYLNQRTMEAFRQHGVEDAILEVGAPIEKFGKVRWTTSMGGDGPLDQKLIHEMDSFGGGELLQRYQADSPTMSSNYPQLRLEPLLRAQAEQRAPGQIRFNHEVTGWEQTSEGVTVQVTDHTKGEDLTVKARYVIAADGGRTTGPKLGVEMAGPTNMLDMVSTHFSCDLSQYWDDGTLINWFLNPEGEHSWGSGVVVQMGPTWGKNSEEFVLHFAYMIDDDERFNEEAIVPRMKTLLRLPDIEPKVHKVSHWILERVVAQQWRYGDVFLAGDAAHRQPPTSGLGLNTGIQDAYNLTWKLAQVLSGKAGDALLDSYEKERLPVATDGADWALLAFMNHAVIDAGIGLTPGAPKEVNTAAFQALFSDTRLGRALRSRSKVAIDTQSWEFQAHDMEIGFDYEGGAVIDDGSQPAVRDDRGRIYAPSTKPGQRLPHAWLDKDGHRVSTHDLTGTDSAFVLITGPEGSAWAEAAAVASEKTGVTVKPVVIGGDHTDIDGTWATVSQLQPGGAVLVRPDNHVAWRSQEVTPDAAGVLTNALSTVLGV